VDATSQATSVSILHATTSTPTGDAAKRFAEDLLKRLVSEDTTKIES
jgi:hypothetical protein